MIEKVSKQMQLLLAQEEKFSKDSEQYRKYSEALLLYKKMVYDGLIKPRGNQLVDIEERSRGNIKYNIPFA